MNNPGDHSHEQSLRTIRKWIRMAWIIAGIVWLVAIAGAIAIGSPLVFEAPLYITILLFVLSNRSMQSIMIEAGALRSGFIVGLLLIMTVAHLMDDSRRTYPLARWTMYSNARPVRIVVEELAIIDRNGDERIVAPWSIVGENYARGIYRRLTSYDKTSPEFRDAILHLVADDLRATPDARIEWRVWEMDSAAKPYGSSRELLESFVIMGDGSNAS